MVLPVPPLEVQKQIVAEIDGYQKVIDGAKQVVDNWKPSFRIDSEWKIVELGKIGKISMCKRIFKNETSDNGKIPFYKIGTFGKVANAFISQDVYNKYRKKYSFPKKGEILLSASGTIEPTCYI